MLHGVGALARVLDHDVADIVDEVGVVAEAARHGVVAGPPSSLSLPAPPSRISLPAEAVEDVVAAPAEDLVLRRRCR